VLLHCRVVFLLWNIDCRLAMRFPRFALPSANVEGEENDESDEGCSAGRRTCYDGSV
jgi:hypothetical protein